MMGKSLCSPTKVYRKTLESIVKLVPPDQIAPVELRALKFDVWKPVGAVIGGELKEGPEYFHACHVVKFWKGQMYRPEYEQYSIRTLYETGELLIPKEKSGLTNYYIALGMSLTTQRQVESGTLIVLTPLGHKVLTIAKEISDVG